MMYIVHAYYLENVHARTCTVFYVYRGQKLDFYSRVRASTSCGVTRGMADKQQALLINE